MLCWTLPLFTGQYCKINQLLASACTYDIVKPYSTRENTAVSVFSSKMCIIPLINISGCIDFLLCGLLPLLGTWQLLKSLALNELNHAGPRLVFFWKVYCSWGELAGCVGQQNAELVLRRHSCLAAVKDIWIFFFKYLTFKSYSNIFF